MHPNVPQPRAPFKPRTPDENKNETKWSWVCRKLANLWHGPIPKAATAIREKLLIALLALVAPEFIFVWALRQWLRARSIAEACSEAAEEYERSRRPNGVDVDKTVAEEIAELIAELTVEPAAEAAKMEDNVITKLSDTLATGPTAELIARARARAISRTTANMMGEASPDNVETDQDTISEFSSQRPSE